MDAMKDMFGPVTSLFDSGGAAKATVKKPENEMAGQARSRAEERKRRKTMKPTGPTALGQEDSLG